MRDDRTFVRNHRSTGLDALRYLTRLEYDYFLFVDADTYFVRPVKESFIDMCVRYPLMVFKEHP